MKSLSSAPKQHQTTTTPFSAPSLLGSEFPSLPATTLRVLKKATTPKNGKIVIVAGAKNFTKTATANNKKIFLARGCCLQNTPLA